MSRTSRLLLWFALAGAGALLLGACYVESGPAYGPPPPVHGRAYYWHDYGRR